MKKRIFSLLLAIVLVVGLLPMGVFAAETDNTITIDGSSMPAADLKTAVTTALNDEKRDFTITGNLTEEQQNAVGSALRDWCGTKDSEDYNEAGQGTVSLTLPDVTEIFDNTFGEIVLDGDDGVTQKSYALKSVNLPEVSVIGDGAFSHQHYLQSVTAPKVVEVKGSGFGSCNALTQVNMPNVKKVGNYSFSHTSFADFPFSNLQEIGNYAFQNNSGELTSIYLSNATSIGNGAFRYGSNLESFTAAKLTVIPLWAFADCKKLTTLSLGSPITEWGNQVLNNVPTENITLYLHVDQKTLSDDDNNGVWTIADGASGVEFGTGKTFCGYTFKEIVEYSEHTYGEGWKSDSNSHWHECICGARQDEAAHSGGTVSCTDKAECTVCGEEYGEVNPDNHNWGNWISNDNGTHTRTCANNANHTETDDCSGGTATCAAKAECEGCGQPYGDLVQHSAAAAWRTNETHHWHLCVYWTEGGTCQERFDYAEHADADNNGACDACGYTMTVTPPPHTHSLGYKYHESGHWQECTDASCPDVESSRTAEEAHSYWSTYNETHHWWLCACGAEQENSRYSHGFENNNWYYDNKLHYEECFGCSYHKPEGEAHVVTGEAVDGEDPVCDICRSPLHDYAWDKETWDIFDHMIVCSRCDTMTWEEHSDGADEDKLCDACQFNLDCLHGETKWVYNADGHYWECTDCGQQLGNTAAHTDANGDDSCDFCDYEIHEHIDADKNHKCDRNCGKTDMGAHTDANKDHNCDYGCQETIGTHADAADDIDHVCDYGCGEILEDCSDKTGDNDHKCDVCGTENVTEHSYGTDRTCDTCGYTKPVPYFPIITPTYDVENADDITGGEVSASKKVAYRGDTITITVDPDDGYELTKLTVTDSRGNAVAVTEVSDSKYTFKMPGYDVEIDAAFAKIDTTCPGDWTCPMYGYTDLNTSLWYHDGIHFCIEHGLMQGVGNNEFNPNGTTTRAMIVTILWRLEGSPVVNYAMDFEDVAADQWYTEAIRWAASEKIVEGYGDGKFGTNDPITREQFVTIMFRYAKYKGYDVSVGENTNILSYGDAFDVAEWAIPAMQWACGESMIQGIADGSKMNLAPQGNATRAQAAAILQRFIENVVNEK